MAILIFPSIILANNGIQKIDDGLYVGKKNDLYFVFERVTPKNYSFWQNYGEDQHKKTRRLIQRHGVANTITTFLNALKFYEVDDVWVAYATSKNRVQHEPNLVNDIEMSVPVLTNKDVPFYSPRGIFRADEFSNKSDTTKKYHGDLAIPLQSFMAQAIKEIYGNKEYMITNPVEKMKELIQTGLRQQDKEKIWVGSADELEDLRQKKSLWDSYAKDPKTVDLTKHAGSEHMLEFSGIKRLDKDIEKIKNMHKNFDKLYDKLYEQFQDNDSVFTRDIKAWSVSNQAFESIWEKMKKGEMQKNEVKQHVFKLLENLLIEAEQKKPQVIQKDIEEKQKYYKDKFKKFFPEGKDTGSQSPLLLSPDYKTMSVTLRNGEKTAFSTPKFYYDIRLQDPTVIVDIDALAGLLKLDKFVISN